MTALLELIRSDMLAGVVAFALLVLGIAILFVLAVEAMRE